MAIITFTTKLNGKPYPKSVFPLKTGNLLDEQLDEAYLTMVLCKEEHFDMLTRVQIDARTKNAYGQVTSEKSFYYVIANDKSTLTIKDKKLYKHEIYLIEETKLLEGLVGDSIVFTNTLGNLYLDQAPYSVLVYENAPNPDDFYIVTEKVIKSVVKNGELLYLPKMSEVMAPGAVYIGEGKSWYRSNAVLSYEITITQGGEEIYRLSQNDLIYDPDNEGFTFVGEETPSVTLNEGTYKLSYFLSWSDQINGEGGLQTIVFNFNATSNRYPLKKWTITDVVQRTLDLIEPHLDGYPNRFTFNEEQAEEYKNVIAPEFAFTKENLRERLQQIGGFIHAEPRLRNGVIYFDKYGMNDYADMYKTPYTGKMVCQDINHYATNLDSSVDNLVSQLSWAKGVIMEPFAGGYRSVRTESMNVRITEENMLIQTIFPVYQVEKLTCAYIKDGEMITCDITPYVFESVDYNSNLSSYSETYPTSKAFGVYYTQGERNIRGLNFKVPDAISDILRKYAIINILEAVSGENFGWFDKIDYPTLMFQITYIPIFSTRVTQTKQYIVGMQHPFALPYNQGANMIETSYYGENMKGLIARLGNVEKTLTYMVYNLNRIPKAGQLFDDEYYISAVFTEFMPSYIKVQLTLSKDFNRLSQYINVPSYKRFYEVSERQAFRRETLYTDYLVIGNEVEDDGQTLLNPTQFFYYLKAIFTQDVHEDAKITAARVWGKDKGKNNLYENPVIMPVLSTAMGTTMNFSFSAEDNYSAGARSIEHNVMSGNNEVTGYWQQYLPYGDYYGRMYWLSFQLVTSMTYTTPEAYLQAALDFPKDQREIPTIETVISAVNTPILYRKDSREIMNFTYQASFVTNRKNIVIGSALAAMNPLIKGSDRDNPAGLFISPHRINKFDDFVDVSEMTQQDWTGAEDVTVDGTVMRLGQITASVEGKAWAIVYSPNQEDTEITVEDEDGNVTTQKIPVGDRLLIACNMDVYAGQLIILPSISIVHNIFKETMTVEAGKYRFSEVVYAVSANVKITTLAFTSNNQSYTGMSCTYNSETGTTSLSFISEDDGTGYEVYNSAGEWTNAAFRNIEVTADSSVGIKEYEWFKENTQAVE
jgi:hypothetical protein